MPDSSKEIEVLTTRNSQQFIPTWYDSATEDHFWIDQRFEFILEAIEAAGMQRDQALKILDIGSGNGVVSRQIEAATSWVVDCVELDDVVLAQSSIGRGRKYFYDI